MSPSADQPGEAAEPTSSPDGTGEPAAPRVSRESSPVPVLTVDAPTAVHEQIAEEVVELVPAPDPIRGLAGEIAVDIAHQLADPVRGLRDRLGLVVDHIERHVATATGPTPYPWRALQTLRQDLAAAYLEATTLARRLDELDRALRESHATWFDAAAAVELGVHLAGHHLGPGIEVLIDLGNPPLARGVAGPIALLVAQIVSVSARSARDLPGSTVSVRVSSEPSCALVAIADNGAGSARAAGLGDLARGIVAAWGGTVDATSLPGAGCTFELRLSTVRDEPG